MIFLSFLETPQREEVGVDSGYSDVAMLWAYKLKRNWKTRLVLTAFSAQSGEEQEALDFLKAVVELARVPNVEFRFAYSVIQTFPAWQFNRQYRNPPSKIF